MTKVNFYNCDGSRIVRTRTYANRVKACAAIKRAQKKRQIAAFAASRIATDQPTCHH